MNGREIAIGVTGGIAAYKTAALVSKLAQAGAGVSVVLTHAASRFVGKDTFAALSGRPVATDAFSDDRFPLGAHIAIAEKAELLCVAPATADFLAKLAHGIADDLLSTLALAIRGPILVAPSMNDQMWAKPAVARNIDQLRQDGVTIVEPDEGWLSCRQIGKGRMAEPDLIYEAIGKSLADLRAANQR